MLNLIKLENRIVLDGAGIASASEHNEHADAHDPHGPENGNGNGDVPDPGKDAIHYAAAAEAAALLADLPEASSSEPLDIVLVSDNLPDYQELTEAANPEAVVIIYNGDTESAEEVVKRVTDLSREYDQSVNSLTVLSHGGDGYFNLGNEMITAENIEDNAGAWADLDDAMSDDGRIYIYGCEVAEDPKYGRGFLDHLSEVTGAVVFGSNDVTGNNGDWDLEVSSDGDGDLKASPPLNFDLLPSYLGSLQEGPIFPTPDPPDPNVPSLPNRVVGFEDEVLSLNFTLRDGDGQTPSSQMNVNVNVTDPQNIVNDVSAVYSGVGNIWTINITPHEDQFGDGIGISVVARDQDGNVGMDSFILDILPVNDPPVAFNDEITTEEDTPITARLQGDDPVENDPIVFRIVEGPEHGTITNFEPDTGQYTYVPDSNYFGPDEFQFQVDDQQSENNLSNIATVEITVLSVPDKPEVETSEGNAEYIENDPPVVVDPLVEVSDIDSEELSRATVQITGNYQNDARGQDVLRFTDQSGITGSWNPSIGTLTLRGTATVAEYQAALRTISFEHVGGVLDGDDPNENVRTVTFTVTDETGETSDPASRGVFVDAINDAPDLEPETGVVTYVEACGPIPLGDDFQLSDVDDENMTRAVIQITDGYIRGEDVLEFTGTSNITGSWISATGTLTLTGTASEAAYVAALESVTYNNTGAEVDPGSREITITIRDANSRGVGGGPGGGFKTDSVTRTVEMEINEPPVLDLDSTDGTPEDGTPPPPVDFQTTYPAGSDGVLLTDSGIVLDIDDTQLSALRVEIRNMGNGDVLNFDTDGTNISGNYNPSSGTLLLSGVDSIQNYQQVLNTITYSNSNDTFSEDQIYTREIEFQATDNGGNTCAIKDSNVAVAFVNILPGPTVEDVDDINTFIENCGPVLIAETASVESPTGSMIQELRVAITNVQPEDVLNADVSGTNISMNYQNGVLALTGAATAETYQQVLRTVTFENTSEAPNSVQRNITYQVTDTEGRTGGEEALANVVPVNDAPINELPGQIVAPTNTSIDIDNISIRDVDVGDGQVLVTLRSDFGVIQIAGEGSGAEINNNGGSIVTIEGTVAQVNAALQGLTYTPLTDFSGEDRLSITVNDQGYSGVHPIDNVQANCEGLIGISLDENGQVPPFPNEGTPQDPTALEDQDVIIIRVTESDTDVVPEIPGTPDVPFLPITRPEGRDIDGITLEAVRLPGPVGITEGVGRPLFEARALAGRDFFDFCSIEESLRSHLGCRFANTRDPEAQFGSITWTDFTDLGWIPPYEHLDEEYDLYSQLFLREQGDPGFNVQANAFQRDLGGMKEQPQPPEVFEEKAGKEGFNELDPGEVKRTFFAGREHLDKTGR
jgi:hypothetical protein